MTRPAPLPPEFFVTPTVDAARRLLGMILVDNRPPGRLLRIVETEAYTVGDPACHAFRGQSKANAAMFGRPGQAYVHINYGLHHCINAVFQPEGIAEAVLIRAVEPIPLPEIPDRVSREALRTLWAGPGRLARTLGIIKSTHDAMTLDDVSGDFYLAQGAPIPDRDVTTTTRIGITKGADSLWRFYVRSSPLISRRAVGDPIPSRAKSV